MVQMKLFLFCLVLYFNTIYAVKDICKDNGNNEDTIINGILCGIIDQVKNIIKNGNSDMPPLDPFKIATCNLNFSEDMLSGHLNVTNLTFQNLSDFVVSELSIFSKPSVITLNFETLNLTTKYSAKMNVMNMIKIYGDGNFNMIVNNVSITASILSDSNTIDAKIVLNTPTPIATTNFTGLLNDEHMSYIISKQLSKTITTLVAEYINNINDALEKLADWLISLLPFRELEKKKLNDEDIINIFTGILKELLTKYQKMLL
ncbi:hypothetical protein FQA39_LY13530 [Lamprigera yunnana]|nr:hypothetical protein FQA39_LY13530 [Lamprigera yunnana]